MSTKQAACHHGRAQPPFQALELKREIRLPARRPAAAAGVLQNCPFAKQAHAHLLANAVSRREAPAAA
jgi:hypothetical protein